LELFFRTVPASSRLYPSFQPPFLLRPLSVFFLPSATTRVFLTRISLLGGVPSISRSPPSPPESIHSFSLSFFNGGAYEHFFSLVFERVSVLVLSLPFLNDKVKFFHWMAGWSLAACPLFRWGYSRFHPVYPPRFFQNGRPHLTGPSS